MIFPRKGWLPLAILAAIAAFPITAWAAAEGKPNIIVIVGDDMGYADIGVHGCKDIPTPNIDSLAAAGVRCTNGYVSARIVRRRAPAC